MGWDFAHARRPPPRRRHAARMFEVLEDRTLLADGITPAAGTAVNAVAGVPITSGLFATYTVSDPSGAPGTQWRAQIDFGDEQTSRQVTPVQDGSVFDIEATHTYATPGTYTVTVMIAVPGSHTPNDNAVTMQVNVAVPTPTPTPAPPPPRRPSRRQQAGPPTPAPPTPPPTAIGAFQSSGLDAGRNSPDVPSGDRTLQRPELQTRSVQRRDRLGRSNRADDGPDQAPRARAVQVVGAHRYPGSGRLPGDDHDPGCDRRRDRRAWGGDRRGK